MNVTEKIAAIKWIEQNIDNNDVPPFAKEMFAKAKARFQKSVDNAPKVDPRKAELQAVMKKAREELKKLNEAKAPKEEKKVAAPKVTAKK